ncbi:MAG: LysM peptidoglycan-binding domain-containing protein [Oscillospiraceae bacterium]|nr:LysM peptidoglycan-binding domain-containing protein [Oscillospiraceae bacterium]
MEGEEETSAPASTEDSEAAIWKFLFDKLGNAYGTAGLMGNLFAESGLKPTNLQNTYEKKLGYTDTAYTAAVDDGTYDNFVKDCAGYGLAQWTYWSRKQGLLEFAKAEGKSIGDLGLQLDYIWKELSEGYGKLLKTLQTATSVTEASTAVLTQYERPADMGEAVQAKRASFGQSYFDKYAPKPAHPERLTTGFYRVRKTWADKKSQLGAYRILANAKGKVDKNPGYFVFTEDGTAIYPAESEKKESYTIHTVVPGDTLWKISERYLGKGIRYTEIRELNGLTSNIIYRGMKLKIPN